MEVTDITKLHVLYIQVITYATETGWQHKIKYGANEFYWIKKNAPNNPYIIYKDHRSLTKISLLDTGNLEEWTGHGREIEQD